MGNQGNVAKLVKVRREAIENLEKEKYNSSFLLAWNVAKVFHIMIEEIFIVIEDEV